MTAKDITLDLIIRYGFQVLGAIIILTVGILLARWIGNVSNRWLESRVKEPPMRLLMVRAIRILVILLTLLVRARKHCRRSVDHLYEALSRGRIH